jgi:hypothetical protein
MTNHKINSMELYTRNYVHGASTLWKLVCNKLLKLFPLMGSEIPLLCSQVNPFHTVPSYVVKLHCNIILAGVPSDVYPQMKKKNQLDATWCFITLMIGLTCFGQHYAHYQELTTISVSV